MKKLIFIGLAIAAITTAAQNFEGIITYRNSYKSKLPKLSDEQFTTMMGSKQEFYIKEGNYKSILNGTFEQWQLYSGKENKLYTKLSNSDTISWKDGSQNDDSVFEVQHHKSVVEILGYSCDELIFTCKSGIQKYYFNTALRVNASLYSNLKYGNWYDFIKRSNALPLKIILESNQFVMESVATEIKPLKVDDKEFELPKNAKTKKRLY